MDININKITNKLLSEITPTIGLYPGKFKPPHKGHFYVVENAAKICDEVHIIISNNIHEGYDDYSSKKVWETYKKHLPNNVKIKIAKASSPVTEVYNEIKNRENNYLVIYGKEEEGRFKAIRENREKYWNADIVDAGNKDNLSSTQLRECIRNRNIEGIKQLIPEQISVHKFLFNFQLHEIKVNSPGLNFPLIIKTQEEGQRIAKQLHKAGYTWELGSPIRYNDYPFMNVLHDDTYPIKIEKIKHNPERVTWYPYNPLFHNESKQINEEIEINKEKYLKYINKCFKECCEELKIPQPKLEIIYDDSYTKQNKSYGGYSPLENKIYLVIYGRNLKDSCVTLSHECKHAEQNYNNRLTPESGEDGDEFENESNAFAGKFLRQFGRNNPEIYFMRYN
jgi:cytidyltransferase-like protein